MIGITILAWVVCGSILLIIDGASRYRAIAWLLDVTERLIDDEATP